MQEAIQGAGRFNVCLLDRKRTVAQREWGKRPVKSVQGGEQGFDGNLLVCPAFAMTGQATRCKRRCSTLRSIEVRIKRTRGQRAVACDLFALCSASIVVAGRLAPVRPESPLREGVDAPLDMPGGLPEGFNGAGERVRSRWSGCTGVD